MTKLYWVGYFDPPIKTGHNWHFVGVFDTQEKALAACKNEYYFMPSFNLNEVYTDAHYLNSGYIRFDEDGKAFLSNKPLN